MTIDEVRAYQKKLRHANKGAAEFKGRPAYQHGSSAVGRGQFVEGTMVATLNWMAKQGMIPRNWHHMKFDHNLQDRLIVANAQRLGADPNKVDKWGRKEERVVKQQWESVDERRIKRIEQAVLHPQSSNQPQPQGQSKPVPQTGTPSPEDTKSPSQKFNEVLTNLMWGHDRGTAREGWAKGRDQRDKDTPGLHQQIIKPDPRQLGDRTPVQQVSDAAKGIVQQITNVIGGHKGQKPPVSINSSEEIPSPTAEMTTLSYKLYFHVD
jgi:hypothetical protein